MNGASSTGGSSGMGGASAGMHASNQGGAAAHSAGTQNSAGDTSQTHQAAVAAASGVTSSQAPNQGVDAASEQQTASPLAHFSSESPASMSPQALSTQQQVQAGAASVAAATTPEAAPTAAEVAGLPASFTAMTPQAFAAPAQFDLARAAPSPNVSVLGTDLKAPKTSFDTGLVATLTQSFNLDKGTYSASLTDKGMLHAGDSLGLSITASNLGTPLVQHAGAERAEAKATYTTKGFELNAGVQNLFSPQANAFANMAISGEGWKVQAGVAYDHSHNLKGTLGAELNLTDHVKAYASVDKQESAYPHVVAGLKYEFNANAFVSAEVRKDIHGPASGYFGIGLSSKF